MTRGGAPGLAADCGESAGTSRNGAGRVGNPGGIAETVGCYYAGGTTNASGGGKVGKKGARKAKGGRAAAGGEALRRDSGLGNAKDRCHVPGRSAGRGTTAAGRPNPRTTPPLNEEIFPPRTNTSASKRCGAYTGDSVLQRATPMLNVDPRNAGSFLNRLETTTPEVLCNWNEMGHNIGLAEIFLLTAQGWAAGGVSGDGPFACCTGAR